MLRFIGSFIGIFFGLLVFSGAGATLSLGEDRPVLPMPVSQLFKHKNHIEAFKNHKISCTDCHSFNIKNQVNDPLSDPVQKGLLKPSSKVCHVCHFQAVRNPIPNQCALCHKDLSAITPESHKLNWKFRHGRVAENNPEACRKCHQESTCTQCHTQRDQLKPSVHRPNFRMTHSIEARARPESCATCHSTTSSCITCHTRGLK